MAKKLKDRERKVLFDEGCGLHYLPGKTKVIFENGIVIPKDEYNKHKPKGTLKHCIDTLEKSEDIIRYDFKYAVSTGDLRKKPLRRVVTEKKPDVPAVEAKEVIVETPPVVKKETAFSSSFILTAVMTVVGIGCAIMSAYNTSVFQIAEGKPVWAAVITGTMLILFSATAFTAARYFLNEKGLTAIFGFLFIAAGVAVISYSMFSTLTVNFNQFRWKNDAKVSEFVADSEVLASHRKLVAENEAALQEVNEEIANLETDAEYWKDKSWRRYDEFQELLRTARNRRASLREERTKLNAATPDIVEKAAVSNDTIYSFLARLFGLKEDVARFFVYVVPACLYDLLAPFALSVVLLLHDKQRKKETYTAGANLAS